MAGTTDSGAPPRYLYGGSDVTVGTVEADAPVRTPEAMPKHKRSGSS